jgi:DNA replication protein DnaC
MEKIKKTVSTILAMTARMANQATMQPSSPAKTAKKLSERDWLDKWIKLKTKHSKSLQRLEHEVYQFCRDYALNPATGKRMVIYGLNGAGKSHTARAIVVWAQRVAVNLPLVNSEEDLGGTLARARYVNWPAFLHAMKGGEWEARGDLEKIELLALDDIGAEHDPSKVGAESLYLILERREFRWTVITTNVKREDWDRKFEKRIASRLLRNTIRVDVSDVPDYQTI